MRFIGRNSGISQMVNEAQCKASSVFRQLVKGLCLENMLSNKVFIDTALFGLGITQNGNHIPLEDIYMSKLTMIERVAEALFEAFKMNNSQYMMDKLGFLNIKFNQLDKNNHYRKMFSSQARIAIQAMREPTEEMIDAGAYDLDMTLKSQYQKMIDKALEE